MPDYYNVLGIHKTADDKTIRQAYRRLARKYHPDVNPGDSSAEESFKNVNEAYSVLSNSDNRRQYDRYGEQWKNRAQYNEQHFSDFNTGSGFSFDPWSMFGGSHNRTGSSFREHTNPEPEPVIEPEPVVEEPKSKAIVDENGVLSGEVEIKMSNLKFVPSEITIKKGTTILWKQVDRSIGGSGGAVGWHLSLIHI